MNQIDEESLNYHIYHTEINPKINFKINNIFQKETYDNDLFEKAFKSVFNEKNNIILEDDKDKDNKSFIIEQNIFKTITPLPFFLKYDEDNEKYFPFTRGIGLNKCLKNIGYLINFITPFELNLSTINEESKFYNNKFKIIDYSEKGKLKIKNIKKLKKKRKYKPDDIRKKITSKFHRVIKNIININLKKAGSKKLFDFFPQYFISNVTIKLNNIVLNYTYEELIKIDMASEILKKNKADSDLEKYNRNLDVLNYLNNEPNICQVSLFNKIKNMKYMEMLNAYFISKEFEDSIFELYTKSEKIEYIEEYINKALNYVHFYSTIGAHKQNTNDTNYDKSNEII